MINRKYGYFFIVVAIGVIAMLNFIGCGKGEFEFVKYSSRTPSINITMDYLKGWTWLEHTYKEKNYSAVIFIQLADNKQGVFRGNMEADVFDATKLEVKPQTLEAFTEDIIAKRLKYSESKLLKKSRLKLLGTQAIDIEISFKILEKLHAAGAKRIPVKTRMVIFQKADRIYLLKLMVREEDYDRYNRAFDHIIKSLRIKKQ